jgi:thiosulfate/3-mercaptopyruvate sulfurtransferase
MKRINYLLLLTVFLSITAFINQQEEPWRQDQLLEPKDLAATINNTTSPQPLIICIGPAGLIKNAINIGPTSKKENLDSLKNFLSKEKKDRQIVIYCGCCPFKNCPNIRPAFTLLNKMKFTNQKLLNLSHNLKADWIDQGYPMTPRQ